MRDINSLFTHSLVQGYTRLLTNPIIGEPKVIG